MKRIIISFGLCVLFAINSQAFDSGKYICAEMTNGLKYVYILKSNHRVKSTVRNHSFRGTWIDDGDAAIMNISGQKELMLEKKPFRITDKLTVGYTMNNIVPCKKVD